MKKARKLPNKLPAATRIEPSKLKRLKDLGWKRGLKIAQVLQEAADLWLDHELDRE